MKNHKLFTAAAMVLSASVFLAGCDDLDKYDDTMGPSMVSGFSVKSLDSGDAVEFKWTDPTDKDFDHVEVEYKVNGEARSETVPAGTGTLTVSGLNHETGYQFQFYTVDTLGNKSEAKQVGAFATKYNGGYMLSYFKSNSDGNDNYESLFLAKSEDGRNFTALLDNTYYYKISESEGSGKKAVRDPYMNRLHDNNPDDNISWFVELATDWTNYKGTDHPEYGTKGFTSYWDSLGYSPSIFVSIVKVDTENKTVDFLRPAAGTNPYGATVNGSTCKRMITLPDEVLEARGGKNVHAWAPEILMDYNADGSAKPIATIDGTDYYYGVIWSGNGDVVLENADGSYQEVVTSKAPFTSEKTIAAADFDAEQYNEVWICRTYINYTNDFNTFTRPYFYFEDIDYRDCDKNGSETEAISEIDATMIKFDGIFYMPFKGELDGAKDINIAKSNTLDPNSFVIMHNGQWLTRTKNQSVQHGIEGPWLTLDEQGRWWLFGDEYSRGKPDGNNNFIGCVASEITAAPKYWSYHDNDNTYVMPRGIRHGFAFRVTAAEMETFESVTGSISY